MSFVAFAVLTTALLGSACWASNIWPGVETLWRAAVGRLLWWGGPFAAAVWINGAPLSNALYLGAAAWLGAWVPHVRMPDVHEHWATVLADAIVVIVRVTAMLAAPTAVFWTCGAYWPAMMWAVVAAAPCMQASVRLPHGWPGLRNPSQVAGVLFGAAVGLCLAVAVWAPSGSPDLLP